jgi:hypothetical protein
VILTIALAALIISALLLVLYGGGVGEILAARLGLGDAFLSFWKIAQWPIALVFMLAGFALIYRCAPNLSTTQARGKISRLDYRRRWLSPESWWQWLSGGVTRLSPLPALFRFIQRDLWIAGRIDCAHALVLFDRCGNFAGR